MNKKLVFLLIALILLVLSISFFKRNTDNSIKLPDNESINVSSHVCLVGYLWLNLDGDERCYKECPNGMRDCVNSTDSTCAKYPRACEAYISYQSCLCHNLRYI